ncbi:MAG: hypothetical protein ABIK07_26955 [Planctomycetota bacterium]
MEWFAFLIYFLSAICGALVVWFAIKVGFRVSAPVISQFPESAEITASETEPADKTPRLYWNFTAALIIVPTLLLVLGIAVRQLPILNPVTCVLGGALALTWLMSLWSGMLSFQAPLPAEVAEVPPELTAPERAESEDADFRLAEWTITNTKEAP